MLRDFNEIVKHLVGHQRVLICIHEDPDADAVGSAVATSLVLQQLGKQTVVVYEGVLREIVNSLSPLELLTKEWPEEFIPDAILVLDSSAINRVGLSNYRRLSEYTAKPIINIDHHVTNENFGTSNYVEPTASSTCEIIGRALFASEHEITPRIASLLLAGIVSDTGRFQYDNSSADTLRIAARLQDAGANLSEITQELEIKISLNALHLWGHVLERACFAVDKRIIYSGLTKEVSDTAKDAKEVQREIVAMLRRASGMEIAILFVEKDSELTNVSMRSFGAVDCAKIAKQFDGGGHSRAAGCRVKAGLQQAQEILLEYIKSEVMNL